jgi:hypothetical protein
MIGKPRKGRWRSTWALLVGWLFVGVAYSPDLFALARRGNQLDRSSVIRIVSLNCSGGDPAAAAEAFAQEPDIVLFQESPPEHELLELVKEQGGNWSVIAGVDGSVVSKFPATRVGSKRRMNYAVARVKLPDGDMLDVLSLRLTPPVLRFDYWSAGCWLAYSRNRMDRRRELADLVGGATNECGSTPNVMGGDFNTPPDATVTRCLKPMMVDSFAVAGIGWPGTATSYTPVVRIDQIWLDKKLRPVRSWVVNTRHSDHRMVVCDAVWVR